MPMLLSWSDPNHIARVNFFDRATIPLGPSAACSHNQGLSERMRMPRGTRSRLKGDGGTTNKRGVGCVKKRINPYSASKPVWRTFV